MGSDAVRPLQGDGQRLGLGEEAIFAADAVKRRHGVVSRLQPESRHRGAVDLRPMVQISGQPVTEAAQGYGARQPDQPEGIRS